MTEEYEDSGKVATFSLADHLDHTWENELVTFRVEGLKEDRSMAIVDADGARRACQVAHGENETKVAFIVDRLPAGGTRTFTLVTCAESPCPTNRVTAKLHGDTVELSNGLIAIRLPASQAAADLPAPLLAVRRGNGPWIGEGRMFLSAHLKAERIETRQVESGPLWATWQVVYVCEGGAQYTLTARMYTGRAHVEISEASSLCRRSCWEFSVRDGLGPDHSWTHPYRDVDRLRPIDYAAGGESRNLGAIQMPNYSGIWVPDDYHYFAFLNQAAHQGDCVAIVGTDGGSWDYPYENQIDIETTAAGDAFYRFSIAAGHRRWLLAVSDRDEVTGTRPHYNNPIHRLVRQYETPLDKVKDYVLDWEDVPAGDRPFALATAGQLAHARANAQNYAPLREYVESLNPDLPGDHTYYHSGTHRVFDDDHRNDPAVLYVAAEAPAERVKQARFLKDVVLDGLKHRREAMLDKVGHLDEDSSSINLGRGLRPWSVLYDFAASEGVFSPAEERLAKATFAFFCYKTFDPDFWPADHLTLRDDHPRSAHRTHWFPRRQHDWCFYNIDNIPHNFHADLWSAAGCVAMVFPRHPMSRDWVNRTLEFWENELTYWVFPEGAWVESSTYTLNSMKDYLVYCRMLANARIRNYFSDERLKRIFRFLAEALGPYDQRIQATSFPVMGDGTYPNMFCYVLGWMAGLVEEDPAFAGRLSYAWKSTGEYLSEPGRFGQNFCDFLFLDPDIPARPIAGLASKWYRGLGAILRHAQGTPDEIYLFLKAGVIYSHFHEPEGTFQLWWNGRPLCDEYGVQYGTGVNGISTQHPSCHNCIEVPGDPTVYNKGDITTFTTTADFDHVVMEAPIQLAYLPEGGSIWGFKGEMGPAGWHKRHFLLMKPYYLFLYDDLECPYPTKYHLNVKADEYAQQGNRVHYKGRLGVDLEFLALDLGDRTIQHGEFDVEPNWVSSFQAPERFYHQLQLTIDGRPNEDFATLLIPHVPDIRVTAVDDPATGGARVTIDGQIDQVMVFPRPRKVETEDVVYDGAAGVIREHGDTLVLLQAHGTRIGRKHRLTIDGDGPFSAARSPDGTLSINTSGTGRWLTLGPVPFRSATCDGSPVQLERVAQGSRLYVPGGTHELFLESMRSEQ